MSVFFSVKAIFRNPHGALELTNVPESLVFRVQRDIVEIAIVDFGKYQSRDESAYAAAVVAMVDRGEDALHVDYIFGN